MHRLAIALIVATVMCVVSLPWKAEATIPSAGAQMRAATQSVQTVLPAACRGWGAHCPPGYIWTGDRCVPC